MVRPINNPVLAIVCPQVGAASETFIRKHIELLLPGNSVVITSGIVDGSWFNSPVKIVPGTRGFAKYSPKVEEEILLFIKRHHVTHILCEFGSVGTGIVDINSRLLHLPLYVHFHGQDASEELLKPEMVEYYNWMGTQVAGVIAVSIPMAKRLAAIGIPKELIFINHYGVNLPASRAIHDPPFYSSDLCHIVSVSRLVAKKGIIFLLDAFVKARSSCARLTLDIIGEGPLRPEIESYIISNGLSDSVTLHGQRTNEYVLEMLDGADIYAQHSITDPETGNAEGLPVGILEASAHSLPVLATCHEGIPEAIEHGVTGLLVNEGATDTMAGYMVQLAENPDLRFQMGAAGRKKISEEFTVDISLDNLRKILGLCPAETRIVQPSEPDEHKDKDVSQHTTAIREINRVLFVNHNLFPYETSGTPISTLNQALEMSRRGVSVSVLIPSLDVKDYFKVEEVSGVKVYKVPRFDKYQAYLNLIDDSELDEYLTVIAKIIAEIMPDVIHINDYVYMPFGILSVFCKYDALIIRGVCNDEEICYFDAPVIQNGLDTKLCSGPESVNKCAECFVKNKLNVIEPNIVDKISKLLQKKMQYLKLIYATGFDKIIFTELSFKRHFTDFIPMDDNKISIVPRGINFNKTELKCKTITNINKISFGFVGNINFSKGIDILIKAFKLICDNNNFILHIFGNPNNKEYMSEIYRLQSFYPSKFKYYGKYDPKDIINIANLLDVCIIPSYFDSYNRVVREMLLSGVPVISTDFFGASIIKNGINGFKVPVGDYVGIAEQLQKIINAPSILYKLFVGAKQTLVPTVQDEVDGIMRSYHLTVKSEKYIKSTKNPDYVIVNSQQAVISSELFHQYTGSIIIPVFNKLEYTRNCIRALISSISDIAYEVIIIDNGSTDDTREYLKNLSGDVTIITNHENVGYTIACNQGAAVARGNYLVFLNNDTLPQPQWLHHLITTVESDHKVGAVGAKLIYPDGTLQEAGAIVFQDGSALNFGRGDDPDRPQYNVVCEVDYCSGACLLIPTKVFRELGGFDEVYAPAYYEETDFCFRLRERGYKVMYQPLARIIHYGSVTAGLDPTGPLRKYLLINKEKFLNRWNKQLLGHTTSSVAAGKCLQSADRRLAHRSHSITPLAIKEKVVGIRHMSYAQGAKITDIIIANKFTSVLELGFRHGVSTCYMAGALSVLGEGHITTIDLAGARNASPNIEQLLASLGLSSFVTIYYEPTSYIWRLMKMLETVPQPQFDFCYLDGAHSWATDGFAFFLVDKLLKPGGLIIFDDLDWTYDASPSLKETESVKKMPHDERSTPQIRKVFELLVKTHPAYEKFKEEGNWAYAWKRN